MKDDKRRSEFLNSLSNLDGVVKELIQNHAKVIINQLEDSTNLEKLITDDVIKAITSNKAIMTKIQNHPEIKKYTDFTPKAALMYLNAHPEYKMYLYIGKCGILG